MNLINDIDNFLVEKNTRKRESHYPSDISSCMRKLYYKWKDEEESNPTDAGGYWKMSMGNAIHDLINEFLEKAGFDIMNEISNKKEVPGLKHPISYRIDNIFMEKEKLSIIEIKSSYGAGIKNIQREGKPRESDLFQVMLYMFLENIDKAYLLYIGRDNGYRTQFQIDYIQDAIFVNGYKTSYNYNYLIDRLKLVEYYIEKNKLPERDYQVAIKQGEIKDKFQKDKVIYKTDWQCSYCQYCDKCWESDLIKYKDSDNSEVFNNE
jgi:hypothetical protein